MADPVVAEVLAVLVGDLDSEDSGLIDLDDLGDLSDPSHFGLDVHVYIGAVGGKGSDSFDMFVCSPSWFAEHAAIDRDWSLFLHRSPWADPGSVLIGAGLWFMRRWSAPEMRALLATVCADASGGPDWGTVASRIGRSIPWEFDYMYDADVNEGLQKPPSHGGEGRGAGVP
jgi:Immunity protein 8